MPPLPAPRLVALLLALALTLFACTQEREGGPAEPTTGVVPDEATTSTSAIPTTSSTRPVGIEELPGGLQDEVVELVGATEELRGLTFEDPPVVSVVSRDELSERVRSDIEEDIEHLPADQALYELLGLLEPEVDLLALYLDLYGEQVAGFYDGGEGELVVPAGSGSFTPLERATLVHELTHALTDQAYEVWPRYERLLDEDRFDEASAFLSVIEGDAFLTEILYVQTLDPEDRQRFLAESLEGDSEALDRAPQFIRDALVFPYLEGLELVQHLHDMGGFQEVGKAYLDPPVSTEQVITPRDYLRDQPLAVDLPSSDVAGYEEVYESVWGELGFQLMFDQVLGGREEATEGWGGDRYRVWFDGDEIALGLRYRGDTEGDAPEMAAALVEYAAVAMEVGEPEEAEGVTSLVGDDYALVALEGDEVLFLAASDPATGEQLRAIHLGR